MRGHVNFVCVAAHARRMISTKKHWSRWLKKNEEQAYMGMFLVCGCAGGDQLRMYTFVYQYYNLCIMLATSSGLCSDLGESLRI